MCACRRDHWNISFFEVGSRCDYWSDTKGANVSLFNGIFGREWKEGVEKEKETDGVEHEQNSEENSEIVKNEVCATVMIWGNYYDSKNSELEPGSP